MYLPYPEIQPKNKKALKSTQKIRLNQYSNIRKINVTLALNDFTAHFINLSQDILEDT